VRAARPGHGARARWRRATPSVTASPRTCSSAATTSAPCKNCSGTRMSRRRRSTRT
jgi:hypothetical protein